MARARILIVEDDRFYIELYRDILEKEGYKVEVAQGPEETLQRLGGEPFDLVIADMVLKGIPGLELLSQVKKSYPDKDIIMVTGTQSIRKAVDALKLGASDYLTKPVDREELLLAVQKILERQVVSQEQTKLISENIHFYELLRIQKKMLMLLSVIDTEKLQDLILDIVLQELQAPGGTLFMRDPVKGHYLLAASRGTLDSREMDLELRFRTAALKDSLETGKAVMESLDGEQWVPKAGDEGARLILPIRFRKDILGAVRLALRRGEKPYGPFDIDLARHILEAGGMALKNAFAVGKLSASHIQGDLPGTYAPGYFRHFTETQLNVAKRYNRETAMIALTLTNYHPMMRQFKESQVEGVLSNVCQNVLEVIRETDILSRVEENLFGIVVPETDYYGALMLKKRIKARLDKAVYPLSARMNVAPSVQLGCAACPRDGAHYRELLETATRRLEEERKSVYFSLKLERKDFWGMVNRLIDPSLLAIPEKADPSSAGILRPVNMNEKGFTSLARNLINDLEKFYLSRGLLYLGLGEVNPDSPLFAGPLPQEGFKVSIFAMGARGGSLWNISHITPVFVTDPVLAKHLFILAVSEQYSYALFCRRDGAGGSGTATMAGFHSSDQLLVLELISRLQEHYLLQRRIG